MYYFITVSNLYMNKDIGTNYMKNALLCVISTIYFIRSQIFESNV